MARPPIPAYALAILATRGRATVSQSCVSSSIERSSRPALKNRVALASRSSSTTTLSSGLRENGGTAPMTQPVRACADSGLAKPHLRASNRLATALKSSLRLPGKMASTLRRPPPPPRTSSTIALAACSGRLPRITLIFSERPSASCSMTRNLALASVSSATSRSKVSPFTASTSTNDLLRKQLQRLVERRHLAVGRRDMGVDGAAMALLDRGGHQRIDAGLAQGLRHQAHLLPAPLGVDDMGSRQHG